MNRRDRRAAKATRKKSPLPPEYYDAVEGMAVALDVWKAHHPLENPHFVLPPKDIGLIASLGDSASRICRNEAARDIVDLMEFVGRELSDGTNGPTVMMLAAALEFCGFDVERVSLGELGLTVGGRRN